jgi:hypothetical protein
VIKGKYINEVIINPINIASRNYRHVIKWRRCGYGRSELIKQNWQKICSWIS